MATRNDRKSIPPAVREAYQRGFNDGLRQQALALPAGAGPVARPSDALDALSVLTSMALGHIRITSQDAGKVVYAKAALRSEAWPWHYVLYTGTSYPSPASYLSGLLLKLDDVAAGRLRPSPDTRV